MSNFLDNLFDFIEDIQDDIQNFFDKSEESPIQSVWWKYKHSITSKNEDNTFYKDIYQFKYPESLIRIDSLNLYDDDDLISNSKLNIEYHNHNGIIITSKVSNKISKLNQGIFDELKWKPFFESFRGGNRINIQLFNNVEYIIKIPKDADLEVNLENFDIYVETDNKNSLEIYTNNVPKGQRMVSNGKQSNCSKIVCKNGNVYTN